MQLEELALKVGISKKDALKILDSIGMNKISYVDLTKKTGFSLETIKRFKKEASLFLIPSSNVFILNEKGKGLLQKNKSSNFIFTKEHEEKVRDVLGKYRALRSDPKREYDQFYSTEETQIKRLKLLSEFIDLSELNILFLGDDDLTSLCLSALGLPGKIAVLDIDPTLVALISEASKVEKMEIDVYHNDLRAGLPVELNGKFDAVFSDPPYTPSGFELFLFSELNALKNTSGTVFICYGTSERSPERILPVQKIIDKYNLVIDFSATNFNKYEGANSIGNSSNIYVLKKTSATKLPKKLSLSRIYTYE